MTETTTLLRDIADEVRDPDGAGTLPADLMERIDEALARQSPQSDDSLADQEVEEAAALIAKSQGLNWNETCAYEADPDAWPGFCDSSTCIAAHFEDHDPDWARKYYLAIARAVLDLTR
ncbi:hypothetical protein [Aurantiacibacter spongiae]|uniref:Uncharacterized protein n=1 Tax=Aurantiacibacter spongiae TaxID=2488860 RepID=A0A3N5CPH8_9SPHN|nr:hypothetical protein [Aurantiacibacter spongiae]RPF70477.1 hypothetical protein EG799_01660 [Aurantiacibacter spongiae]